MQLFLSIERFNCPFPLTGATAGMTGFCVNNFNRFAAIEVLCTTIHPGLPPEMLAKPALYIRGHTSVQALIVTTDNVDSPVHDARML